MPFKFWDEAFITTTYLINRIPSKIIHGQTPFELRLTKNQITTCLGTLDVLVGQTLDHTTTESFSFVPSNMSS
jgi:hypothetical protein